MNHVEEFYKWCEDRKRDGLVDLKYTLNKAPRVTPESFCEEANSIDAALERGDYQEFVFNDAKSQLVEGK